MPTLVSSLWFSLGFFSWLVFSSFFEWTMHRYVMHRPVKFFRYPFQAHAVVHHQTFKGDHSYHLSDEKDKHTIPMAWWNGMVIVAIVMAPMVLISWVSGIWALSAGGLLAISSYYAVYEYLHWCMHLPKARRLEKLGAFHRLNGHHLLHHRYMHKNFNVILPIADFFLGTLLLRSKTHFAQAKGPSVPDVQPKAENQSRPS